MFTRARLEAHYRIDVSHERSLTFAGGNFGREALL
jgi:hypothetical protein